MNLLQRFQNAGLAGVVALAMSAGAQAAVKVGEAAPGFEAAGADGEPVKLGDLKGQYVVLEWTNEGCPFVQKHYQGNMQGLQKTYAEKGVQWLTVFSSKPGAQGHVDATGAKKFKADYDAHSTALVLDEAGTVGRLYEARTTPHMYVVDKEGTLRYSGAIDDDPRGEKKGEATNYITTTLEALKAGKEVETTQTKPYGCSVKYGS